MPPAIFNDTNFHSLCHTLAARDSALAGILNSYGYPPLWRRKPVFETLVHIILEQQVSLASAKAALDKLKAKTGTITPSKILLLTDEELRACYFSRQKSAYVRSLARAVVGHTLSIGKLGLLPNEAIREKLFVIKGIGNWTVDVFLMMALQRADLFPTGDIALMNSMKHVKNLPPHTTKEEILTIAGSWRPYRTIAAYLLWHAYIQRKGIRG